MQRDAMVQVRVTRQELERWRLVAEPMGQTLPELTRETMRRRIEALTAQPEAVERAQAGD